MSYFSLFVSALLSATLLPGSSEALLAYLLTEPHIVWLLWLCATLGNVLGSVINYGLGWQVERFKDARWFPVDETQLTKAQKVFERYGKWSLLMSWLPIIGDPLTILAGILRCQFWWFCTLVLIGKGARYAAVIVLTQQVVV